MTTNQELQQQLQKEVDHIARDAVKVTDGTFEEPERRVGWGVRLAAWFIKDMF